MKTLSKFLLMGLLVTGSAYAQIDITVTLTSPTDGKVDLKKGATVITDLKDADFSDGLGKLHIINQTTNNTFTVSFTDRKNGRLVFRIPAASIPAKSGGVDGLADYTVAADGTLAPAIAAGKLSAGMGISIKSSAIATDKILLQHVPEKAKTPSSKKGSNDNKLYNYVERQIDKNGYTYLAGQNLIMDDKGTIHIYLDEDGNPIYSYYPVAAKEHIDKFQFHIISLNDAKYVVESDAELNPIDISDEVESTNIADTQSEKAGTPQKYSEFRSPIFGPYSTSFPFTITRTIGNNSENIVDKTIKLLKTNRISVGTAVVATWLKDPGNIATFTKADGTTTLIADDKDTRGFLSLFLTFHFIPRNLNIQPRNFVERLGVSVGTNLSDRSFSNFFLGLNIEVTNGLFFNAGGHFGRVNYAVGYDDFDFGEDQFTGPLEIRKKWELGGPYIAVNIDAALFAKVFKNILGTTPN